MTQHVDDYRRKRDLIYGGLADMYEVVKPGGAFYVFPKAPWGTGSEFVAEAIEQQPADHSRQHLQPGATRTSASPTPPATRRSTAASTCCGIWPSEAGFQPVKNGPGRFARADVEAGLIVMDWR